MPSLDQPNLKVRRAKEHLDALYIAVQAYRESYPHHFFTEDDIERNEWIVRTSLDLPPVAVSLIAGDFIACLRSSLDYVAWQLAMLTTETPSREISFPICEKNTLDTQLKITRCTFQIPEAAVSIMKSLQPYHYGDAYKTSHLWRLNYLWNVEKHRHLTQHSVFADFTLPDGVPVPKWEWFGNKGVMRFPLSAKDKVPLDPRLPVEVVFGDEKQGVVLNIDELLEIYKFVGEKVIPRFAALFS